MDKFIKLIVELEATNSINDKKAVLKKFDDPEVKDFLLHVLNPYKMFNLTSKKFLGLPAGKEPMDWNQVKNILDKLHTRQLSGNEAIIQVKAFLIDKKSDHQDLFLRLLDKDLKTNTGARLVNAVFYELIPQFEVQLCESYEDLETLPFKNTYASRKLDGLRNVEIKRTAEGFKSFSREGNEFTSLEVLNKALNARFAKMPTHVFDGEICIVDEQGNEDFAAASSQVKKKDQQIQHPKFWIFDSLPLEAFDKGYMDKTFEERYKEMQASIEPHENFAVLKQIKLNSPEELQALMETAKKLKWEGLILRNGDAPYEGKRTSNILKVKKFYDQEFKIVGVNEGKKQFTGMLGALVVEGVINIPKHKDFGKKILAEVGSGFKQSQGKTEREDLWAVRSSLPGQIVTVQFFEVTQDKAAKAANSDVWSLRFPTFKVLHGEKRTT